MSKKIVKYNNYFLKKETKMTDQELRELITQAFRGIQELRETQSKTDAQLAKTDAQLAKTDAQLAKTDAQLAETAKEMRETFKGMRETFAKMRENSDRVDEKLTRMGIHLGNISNNQGDVTEEFFYNSLKDKQDLAGIHYDFIDKNMSRSSGKIADEFDIVMVNGRDVAIIETKYKAHEKDLEKLITKKYENFKKLFPIYKDYAHHLALASFHINEDLKEKALEQGVIVLQRKGDVVETTTP